MSLLMCPALKIFPYGSWKESLPLGLINPLYSGSLRGAAWSEGNPAQSKHVPSISSLGLSLLTELFQQKPIVAWPLSQLGCSVGWCLPSPLWPSSPQAVAAESWAAQIIPSNVHWSFSLHFIWNRGFLMIFQPSTKQSPGWRCSRGDPPPPRRLRRLSFTNAGCVFHITLCLHIYNYCRTLRGQPSQ